MPALVAFGRRWQVGGDDFVFPALWSASIRLLTLVAALIVYITEHPFRSCPGGQILGMFMIGMAVILVITVILEFIIAIISAQGSVTDTEPRKWLPVFLYIRLVVVGVEIVWSGVGAFWIFQEWEAEGSTGCDVAIVRLVKVALFAFWALIIVLMFVVYLLFGSSLKQEEEMRERSGSRSRFYRELKASAKSKWQKRCKLICCCAGQDDNLDSAYEEAAEIIASLFGTMDIVPSDFVAGLILMQLEQQRKIVQGLALPRLHPCTAPSLSPPTQPVTDYIEPVAHYFKYASSIYGWPFYMGLNLFCGSCKLYRFCRCCSCMRNLPVTENDNCCQCNTATVQVVTGISDEDIIYITYHNQIYQVPFALALDRKCESIVISIRGSLSLKDALTDVSAEAEKLNIPGHDDIFAHRGMVQAANFVCNKLKELKLIEEAKAKEPDFKLVVVGHSLGGGTAILVSALLKSEWPEVKCYAYGSPFGLINAEGVNFVADFCINVVFGLDIVARLGVHTLTNLKDQIVDVIEKSPTPKCRILLGGCWYTLCGLPKLNPHESPSAPLLGSPIKSPTKKRFNFNAEDSITEEDGNISVVVDEDQRRCIDLFPGGHIFWIREVDDMPRRCCGSPSAYTIQWASYLDFDHILISPYMVRDHLPKPMTDSLTWAVNHKHRINQTESISSV